MIIPGQFFLILMAVPTDGFYLQTAKETRHHGIAPAVAPAAHAGLDAQCRQAILVGMAGVLTALVGMEQYPPR